MFPEEAWRRISVISAIFSIIVQLTHDAPMQKTRHVQAVGFGELLPVLAANAAAAVVRPAGALEWLVEIHDEAAIVDEDFLALADMPGRHDVPVRVVMQVGIARVVDEVVRRGHVADVYGTDDLVEVLIQPVAKEELACVTRQLADLAPVEPDPPFHAVVESLVPLRNDDRPLGQVCGGESARAMPIGPWDQWGPTPECRVHLCLRISMGGTNHTKGHQ